VRRRDVLGGLAAAAIFAGARAQTWPNGPIRFVVPFPAGSAADAIPRAIAARLQTVLGVPCVIDSQPGASGTIGARFVATADADGQTLLSHTSSLVIQPHFGPTPFDPLRDFAPIAQTISGSYVLVTRPDFPAGNLRGWIAAVRAAPGRYSYASHGAGSGPHLAMELLKSRARLFILHVPFRGAAPALQELLAGRLDMAFDTTFATVPHIRAGRLKAIAVGGPMHVGALPGVGRVADTMPGFDTDGWQGLFAPAGTPAAIVQRLADEVGSAVRNPELAARITDLGFQPVGNRPEQLAQRMLADHGKWGRVVRERGIKAE
jgi:tripartite-type tricarboxylate transporter receptor subunit TctC